MTGEFMIQITDHVDQGSPWLPIIYSEKREDRNLSADNGGISREFEFSLSLPPLTDNGVEIWSQFKKEDRIALSHQDVLFLQTDHYCLIQAFTNPFLSPSIQTFDLYNRLLMLAKQQGYSFPQRIWNYVPRINEGEGDKEVYRQFCLGRYRSFIRQGLSEEDFSAASAVGTDDNRLCVALLMAKKEGLHFENPKQQSAFKYPRIYGPKSPSFARATFSPDLGLLFISGTASIIGHQSVFIDDVGAQTRQSFENINALVESIALKMQKVFKPVFFKIYIRQAKDLIRIQRVVQAFAPGLPCLYVRSDICRQELLVEIEGVYKPV